MMHVNSNFENEQLNLISVKDLLFVCVYIPFLLIALFFRRIPFPAKHCTSDNKHR